MRPTKVEDHSDRARVRSPRRAAARDRDRRGGGARGRGHAAPRRARPGAGDARRARARSRSCCSADIWHSPQLNIVHRHPLVAAVGALVALAAVVGGGAGDREMARGARRAPRSSRSRSGSRSRPAASPRTCLCRFTSWSPRARSRSSSRGCEAGRRPDRSPRRQPAEAVSRRSAGRRRQPAEAVSRRSAGRRRLPAARASRARPLARVAAGGLRRPVRAPGGLLAEVHDRAAAGGVLLRAVCARVLPAAQARLDSAANPDLPGARCRARGGVRPRRVRRVRDQDDLPEPQADRRQSGPRLLHGQLGVLRSEHLRSVPRARDDPAGRGDSVRDAGSRRS